jgi:hypothetical protein
LFQLQNIATEASETEGIDADEAEGGDFNKEEEGEDSVSGGFLEGGEDLDSIVSVGREEVGVDCKLIPIMQEESSITDSVSPIS